MSAANITGNDVALFPQFRQRPLKIDNREAAAFPIRHRFLRAQTIEIDCNVNVRAGVLRGEFLERAAPIVVQDRTRSLLIFDRALVGPRMNFEPTFTFGRTIGENVVWPPAFKISTTPDCDMLQQRELERAIDPAAAGPARRRDGPIWMIVERNENKRLLDAANPKRAQVMKIAGAVKFERGELRIERAIKLFHQSRRGAEAELRSPCARVDRRQP